MSEFILHGADYSVYTRIPRLVLEEAGADYRLEPVDIFAEDGPPPDYLRRHPFTKIPALEHSFSGGFEIFETDAIVDYIVAVTGVPLVPAEPERRARMRQIMRIVDNYAYRSLVWDVYVGEYLRGEALTTAASDKAEQVLTVIENLMCGDAMVGEAFSLADCWMVPIVDYLRFAPTGRALLAERSQLTAWWERVETRPSVAATRFPDERNDQSA